MGKDPILLGRNRESLLRISEKLSEILGSDIWKKQPNLLSFDTNTLISKAEFLSDIFRDNRWKKSPHLLARSEETLLENSKVLNEVVRSDKWKSQSFLLARSPESIRYNAQNLDDCLGSDSWRMHPGLLAMSPETIKRSVRYLKFFDINPSESLQHLMLLNTTWKSKADKVMLIRREFLRQNLRVESADDRSRNMQEAIDFISKRPKLLVYSIARLRKMAQNTSSSKINS